MANSKEAFALGLAQKAGKLQSGDFAVKTALKSGGVELLVIAADAAPNTKKELYFLAEQGEVSVKEILNRAELGHAIGKAPRAAVAIMDPNFAKMIDRKSVV